MEPEDFVYTLERDAMIISALCRALYAMQLVNGGLVTHYGITGTLHFDNEMNALERALKMLGVSQ